MDEIDYKLRSQNPTLISHVSMARIIKHIYLHLCSNCVIFQLFFCRQYPSWLKQLKRN